MALVLTDENKDKITSYEALWNTIRDLIRSITNNLDNYAEKHMKIDFNLDDDLPQVPNMTLYVGPLSHESSRL